MIDANLARTISTSCMAGHQLKASFIVNALMDIAIVDAPGRSRSGMDDGGAVSAARGSADSSSARTIMHALMKIASASCSGKMSARVETDNAENCAVISEEFKKLGYSISWTRRAQEELFDACISWHKPSFAQEYEHGISLF